MVPDEWTTVLVSLGRGAALTVVRPFENDPSFPQFEPRIAVAQLFGPTDLQGFVVRYGGNDPPGPSHPPPQAKLRTVASGEEASMPNKLRCYLRRHRSVAEASTGPLYY